MNLPPVVFLSLALLFSSCRPPSPQTGEEDRPPPPRDLPTEQVHLGIDVLRHRNFALLRNAGRIGLITNQTSVDGRGRPTRQVLHEASSVQLAALYTPEHGLDGTEQAATSIEDRQDPLTGLPLYSLYGATRKPTAAMLEPIDTLLFDLQDIGCRSSTSISTMILAMGACAEQGKHFLVLDRPNPLGGTRVQGPPLDPAWKSFLGQIPVPYVHGMTAGELALMANGRGWIPEKCRLTVAAMQGWKRTMNWEDTGLEWVPTSPDIPHARSPFAYVVTGLFGRLTGGDIGIGTAHPFSFCGAPGIDPVEFARALERYPTPGVHFTPAQSPRRPGFAGVRIYVHPDTGTDLVALDITLMHEINKRLQRDLFATTSDDGKRLLAKAYGSDRLEGQLREGTHPLEIARQWQPFLVEFQREQRPFLLYSETD